MRHHALALAIATALATSGARAQAPSLAFLDVPPRPRPAARAPGAEAARGLDELEGELTRFGDRVRDYRTTVDELLSRRARERRRAVQARYDAAVARERAEEGRTRAEAIARLEEFVRRHPQEPRHTPSALLRLADLYVERAYEAPGETLELSDAIAASRRLVDGFPASLHRERGAYLLGWALGESGRGREAIAVWRHLVCEDQFPSPQPAPEPEEEAPHPALSSPDAPRPEPDPYAACRPSTSPLAAEVWLRIGEQHFDAAELAAAIGAYRRVTEHPEDRLFAFGLYKLAWSEYRASRYADAIEHFAQVVQRSDDELRRTGHAGSDLREEALQYVALTLAHDDWDEDGRPDHAAGGSHPLERLEDGSLWPRDRPWSPEVYRRVGEVLFEQAHPDEAIVAWRLRLSGYPPGCDTPAIYLAIVRATRQLGDEDAALATLSELAREVAEDERWRAEACPGQARRAVSLARAALTSAARIRHRRAQRLRERAVVDGDARLAAEARAEYGRAIDDYRRFLASHPRDEEAYAIAYDLADALFWSERFDEAALAYAEVRDSPLDGRRFAEAARRVAESLARSAERAGVILPATDAPTPTAVPEALQAVARAREIYVRWVSPGEDLEHVRDAFAFNNALLVQRYGFAEEARRRFGAVFRARCRGPRASSVGLDAFRALLEDAAAREDAARVEALGAELRQRRCTFAPDGPPVLDRGDCDECIARRLPVLEAAAELRRLSDAARAIADLPDAAARAARATSIAARLVAFVDRHPGHEEAPQALQLAARLLDQEAARHDVARRVYQRIVDQVAPDGDPAHEDVVAEAHFALARAASRAFDYERALASYATIAESARFARSTEPSMVQRRRDALVNAALLTTRLGRHADAARAWTRAAEVLPAGQAREARLRAAEATLEAGDAATASRLLDEWLRAGPATVHAHALRARAAEARGDERRRLESYASALAAYRAAPERADLATATRAALAIADARRAAAGDGSVAPGRQRSAEAFVAELGRQIVAESARLRPVLDAYGEVVSLGDATGRVVALHRQGRVYEGMVRTVLAVRFELPTDVARALRRAPAARREEVREQLQDTLRSQLDERARPVECLAIERYVLAARLARRASLPIPEAAAARARLAAYGEERVRECADAAHARDPTFAPYTPGELDPVRAGRHSAPPADVGPGRLEE